MKKSVKRIIGAAAITASMLSLTDVHASDLTGNLSINDSGLNVMNFEKSYDATKDLNNVNVSVTINKNLIDHVLSQVPGNAKEGASLGSFFLTVEPNIAGSVRKDNMYFDKNVSFEDMKTALDPEADAEAPVNYSTVWINGIRIQYNDGTAWKNVTNKGNGNISTGDNLAALLGVQRSELEYGKNFRFTMTDTKDYLYEWLKADGTREYIKFSYEVKFPVNAKLENGNYAYYPTLEEALTSESKEITINEDLTVTEDVTLPEGVKLTVAEGAKLTVMEGKTLTFNEGNLVSNGTLEGTFTEIKNPVISEEKPAPTDTDKKNENKENTTTKEETKKEDTTTTVVPENKEENPQTFDSIFGYIAVEVMAIVGIIAARLYLKKKKNN